jgi:hypothetical protein
LGLDWIEVELFVIPEEEITYDAVLTIECNDAEEPVIEVQLTGIGIAGCTGGSVGDVNTDTRINVLDVLAVVNYILGLVPLGEGGLCRTDCKADGNINVLDALNIEYYFRHHSRVSGRQPVQDSYHA